jgi:hypothetical protein
MTVHRPGQTRASEWVRTRRSDLDRRAVRPQDAGPDHEGPGGAQGHAAAILANQSAAARDQHLRAVEAADVAAHDGAGQSGQIGVQRCFQHGGDHRPLRDRGALVAQECGADPFGLTRPDASGELFVAAERGGWAAVDPDCGVGGVGGGARDRVRVAEVDNQGRRGPPGPAHFHHRADRRRGRQHQRSRRGHVERRRRDWRDRSRGPGAAPRAAASIRTRASGGGTAGEVASAVVVSGIDGAGAARWRNIHRNTATPRPMAAMIGHDPFGTPWPATAGRKAPAESTPATSSLGVGRGSSDPGSFRPAIKAAPRHAPSWRQRGAGCPARSRGARQPPLITQVTSLPLRSTKRGAVCSTTW